MSNQPKPKPAAIAVTQAQILAAVESGEDVGFCVACGYQTDSVEPDARQYKCDACGKRTVYGAEELLFHIA